MKTFFLGLCFLFCSLNADCIGVQSSSIYENTPKKELKLQFNNLERNEFEKEVKMDFPIFAPEEESEIRESFSSLISQFFVRLLNSLIDSII